MSDNNEMSERLEEQIPGWEDEGGASLPESVARLKGSEAQIEWARRIRSEVDTEFDRVRRALESRGGTPQSETSRSRTEAVIVILEEKRAEVLKHDQAGYFIRVWQELSDQVRRMIVGDPRYREIRGKS